MTQRFSEEYITFVTESEPIQAAWQKRGVWVGDWVLSRKPGWRRVMGLVARFPIRQTDGSHLTSWVVLQPGSGNFWGTYCNKPKRIPEDWFWLPALPDLLQMFEGKGYDVWLHLYPNTAHHVLVWFTNKQIDEEMDYDIMLAAARLFERVLEKEETDETERD